jgi:hypothetical protein
VTSLIERKELLVLEDGSRLIQHTDTRMDFSVL